MATKYIRNVDGGIHSIDEDFLNDRIKEDAAGRVGPNVPDPKYLPHGWEEMKEADARKQAPQLFGAHDDRVIFNAAELKERFEREDWLAKFKAATEPTK